MPTPAEIRAQFEGKIASEQRDETVKAQDFMQQTSYSGNRRAQDVQFKAKPSNTKSSWEKRVDYESKDDTVKAKDFTDKVDWSKKRAQDVELSKKSTNVKSEYEKKIEYEKKADSEKAKDYLKSGVTVRTGSGSQTTREEYVPRMIAKTDEIKSDISARVKYEHASADDKAKQFLEETTYLGVQRRKKKSNLIPLSVLFSKPHKDQLRISPKGTYIAWRTRGRSMADPQEADNGVMNIFVKKRDSNTVRQVTFYKDMDACVHFQFTHDDNTIVFLREIKRGYENYHVHAIDIDPFFEQDDVSQIPEKPRDLLANQKNMTCGIGFAGGTQMWVSPEAPRLVWVSTSTIGPYSMFWNISSLDIDTGDMALVEQNVMSSPGGMIRVLLFTFIARILSFCCIKVKAPTVPIEWFPDSEMSFRGRIEVDLLDLRAYFSARPRESNKWKTLHSCSFEETNLQLVGSSGGAGTARMAFHGNHVDVHLCAFKIGASDKSDTTTYERFNVNTGQYVKRLAGGDVDIKSDITGFANDPNGSAQFVQYEVDKPMLEAIRAEGSVKEDFQYLKSHLKSYMTMKIVSRTADDSMWIIYAENDIGHTMFKGSPSGYFLFTRSRQSSNGGASNGVASSMVSNSIEFIYPCRPEMSRYRLARVYPFHFQARDGEDILCYLTSTQTESTIKGRQQEPVGPQKTPLVVVVHGGPQARDSWGYNPVCQFLSSRGFAVLQVNYRGSTGFGARFLRRGMNGEFCKSVQTDIEDAINYATAPFDAEEDIRGNMPMRPWGDKNQVAILGGSFGGYSALWQITSNPDLYKCAVAICPISSVGAADAESKKAFGGSPLIAKYWSRVFGKSVSKNRVAAIAASPMYQIKKLEGKGAVALYHGIDDPRAPIQHSYNILSELKKCGVAGEMVAFEGEGHGISKRGNLMYMYYRVEEFLTKQFNLEVFDAEDDDKEFESITGIVKWSAEYKHDV